MFLISDLCGLADTYLESDQVKEIYRAYLFGAEAHEGQHRASGEPYIHHPIEVARILASSARKSLISSTASASSPR